MIQLKCIYDIGAIMPFSSNSGKSLVDRTVIRIVKQFHALLNQKSILDIGAGSGTYSDRYSKTWLNRKNFKWIGVEIWEPYVEKYCLNTKYDDIFVGSALDYFKSANNKHDICFMGDVIEHLDKDSAINLVTLGVNSCKVVIVSVPIGHYPQDEYDGNPYEKHVKDDWSTEEVLESLPNVQFYGVEGEIGVFICSKNKYISNLLEPQIGVYAICKDELKFVDRFYDSIKEADQIVICDTGSTDGTFERLGELVKQRTEELCEGQGYSETSISEKKVSYQNNSMKVQRISVTPWRFDDARNNALLLLPEEIDVCVSVDLDELLETSWIDTLSQKVRDELQQQGKISDRYYHRFKTIWNWEESDKGNVTPSISEHWHERIHSRKGYMWKLPVHEHLVKSDLSEESIAWLPDLMMIQKPDNTKPRSSYLKMLEQSVIEDPSRWKSWSFLASEHQAVGRIDDALTDIANAKNIKGADLTFLAYQASKIYQSQQKYSLAISELQQGIEQAPNVREYKVYLVQLLIEARRIEAAKAELDAAKLITERTFGYEYNPACWGEQFDTFVTYVESLK